MKNSFMKNPFQYLADTKRPETKHDWYFEYAGCECGPIRGRDNARRALKTFKSDYAKLLRRYHGGNRHVGIFTD